MVLEELLCLFDPVFGAVWCCLGLWLRCDEKLLILNLFVANPPNSRITNASRVSHQAKVATLPYHVDEDLPCWSATTTTTTTCICVYTNHVFLLLVDLDWLPLQHETQRILGCCRIHANLSESDAKIISEVCHDDTFFGSSSRGRPNGNDLLHFVV